ILELGEAAFATAVAKSFPFLVVELCERLGLPEFFGCHARALNRQASRVKHRVRPVSDTFSSRRGHAFTRSGFNPAKMGTERH
ncbi:hypothetical protein R0J91_16750, partial [Micrococcus sp. SIMBA_131]